MKLIDIIELLSEHDGIKLYVDGEYMGTVTSKGELTYNCLKLKVLHLYVVCNDKQGFLAIDLKR